MTLTIEVPENVAERIRSLAQAEGVSPEDLAVEALADRFTTAPAHDPDLVEKIRRGLADVEAGRTIDFEEFVAQRQAETGR